MEVPCSDVLQLTESDVQTNMIIIVGVILSMTGTETISMERTPRVYMLNIQHYAFQLSLSLIRPQGLLLLSSLNLDFLPAAVVIFVIFWNDGFKGHQ